MRQSPHETLSLTQLKKRLSRAGVRGNEVATMAREIKAGPKTTDEIAAGGVLVIGWPLAALRQKYGRRVARAVTTFVRRKYFIVDEFWQAVPGDLFRELAFRCGPVKVNTIEQGVGQL